MAKVESVNSSSSFYLNNSSFPELNFGLESVDCTTKCDFDISSLLCDNETRLERKSDNDNCNDNKNKNGRSSPLTSLKTESLKLTSLGALAENHLQKNKMLPERTFDVDISLSDLLSNDDCPDSTQNILSCESDNLFDFLTTDDHNPSVVRSSISKDCNLFDFLLTEDDAPSVRKISGPKINISCDDLSQWMSSSVTHDSSTSDSFEFFHIDDHSCDGIKRKLENVSCSQIENKNTNVSESSNIDLVKLLREVSIDSSETTDSLDTADNSKGHSKKHESADEISDNDFLADVDLTYCIKKNSKTDSSFYGNSPDTVDSGFDESDFLSNKLSSPFEGKFFYKDSLLPATGSRNKNAVNGKVKRSLFFRAISAKPKIDDSRKLRLKNVMKELLKGTPLCNPNQHIILKEKRTVDHTNEHVITSSYLKFGDEE